MDILPKVSVPIGDIAGIGPEIAVKTVCLKEIKDICEPILVGPENIILNEAKKAGVDISDVKIISTGDFTENYSYGNIQKSCGKVAYISAKEATNLVMSGRADAIATTPLNKESLKAAGIDAIGYTEMLAGFSNTKRPVTMFKTNNLVIFFLSRHLSLRDACDYINEERVFEGIVLAQKSLELLGILDNSIPLAVAGLNPHNGEHGMFGTEEGDHIIPAINRAIANEINVTGPIPADSVFYLARTGRFSAVLSLYHDQGHIAAKTYDFKRTISLTTGMPFLRTSVDHGTAFDIAGKGIADYTGLIEAVKAAAKYGITYRENYKELL